MQDWDVIVIGAGAAGLFCAIEAGKRARRVLLIEHSERVGKKIGISGGGRCNFTNTQTSAGNFVSQNPHFCKSALARYTPADFVALVEQHGIAYHEKKLGQLFCDGSAQQIIQMLLRECQQALVEIRCGCEVRSVELGGERGGDRDRERGPLDRNSNDAEKKAFADARASAVRASAVRASAVQPYADGNGFTIATNQGSFQSSSLVIATGGLSIPTLGATDFGYRIARQFGLQIEETRPGLVPLTFAPGSQMQKHLASLSGISVDALVSCNPPSAARGDQRTREFSENILITHRGLSGPAILQISNYWRPGETISINLMPDDDLVQMLSEPDAVEGSEIELVNLLARHLPRRFAQAWCELYLASRPLKHYNPRELEEIANNIHRLQFVPAGTEGFRKAEVTAGGVSTAELSSQTMEAKSVAGLYFIGEVVDVTGQLGGYNFQWAWASGYAAGQVV